MRVIHGGVLNVHFSVQVPNVNHPKIEATRYRVVYKKVISCSTLQTYVDDEPLQIQHIQPEMGFRWIQALKFFVSSIV